jgi:sialate O-acetylesterase
MRASRLVVAVLAFAGWVGVGALARADVKPHALFSDNMVLQQDIQVPIWGTADEGENVTVRFQGQEVSTPTANGKWMVRLDKLRAGGPFELTISGKNKIEFKNVLVGEVWICSGQSNMEWPITLSAHPNETIKQSKNPMLRLYTVQHTPSLIPEHEIKREGPKGTWLECGPETVPSFSAVAYFFGRDLQKTRNVPVGLIHTSWGGTFAEAWTSQSALHARPELKELAEARGMVLPKYLNALRQYRTDLDNYIRAVTKAVDEGKPLPAAPKTPPNPPDKDPNVSANLYNGMLAPLIPYAIHGAIWYQGESNAGRPRQYRTLLPAMIQNWRDDWKQGDFTFLIVQLAPFYKIEQEPKESNWAELREAQLLTNLHHPHTGLAVITDVGHETDIHPKQKEPVGHRLALAARALAYGEKIEYSGPVFDRMEVQGDKAILSFTHVGAGLEAKGGALTGFTIAGEDKKFVNAEAEIQGDKVIVHSAKVARPVAARFGWANYPVVNLWNKDGLPASPFRTDVEK